MNIEEDCPMSRAWVLRRFPSAQGISVFSDFILQDVPLNAASTLHGPRIKLRLLYFSNDPGQRSWIVDKPDDDEYMKAVKPGTVMNAFGIGEVVESTHPHYTPGDLVRGMLGWREYVVLDPDEEERKRFGFLKLPRGIDPIGYLSTGMLALTAYFGLLHVAQATSEDRVCVITGAAGAIGLIASQIAKHVLQIPYVVGICGGEAKCQLVQERCGVDKVYNYKSSGWEAVFQKDMDERAGINVVFDNVGGSILDECLLGMKAGGRIAVCGATAIYDKGTNGTMSATAWQQIIFKRLRVEGFLTPQFEPLFEEATAAMEVWKAEGSLKIFSTVMDSTFEDVPRGMERMLNGENFGKLITKLV